MNDHALIRRLEELCFNAWPTLRTVVVDGWVIRLADGHTRRANSANALHPSRLPADELISTVEDLFRQAGLAPTFRLTPLADESLPAILMARGYETDGVSLGMYADRLGDFAIDPSATFVDRPDAQWLPEAMEAYGYGAAGARALQRTFANAVFPTTFVRLLEGDRAIAWGVAVVERGHVGLYDLVVARERRGGGVGRRLSETLLAWGRERGATRAYLQARDENAAARRLYESLGFANAYRYEHFTRR